MDKLKQQWFQENKAKFDILLNKIWYTEDEVSAHCIGEYQLWFNYVNTRRMRLRERRRLYNEVLKDPEKISTNDIYAVMQTLLALYYIDELSVNFMPRNPRYDEMAENIQNLAKFDYTEMDVESLSYRVQRDRLFYWVGIRQLMSWDTNRQVPTWEVKDPLTWIPDPKGSHTVDKFRFMGFESQIRQQDITPEAGFFTDEFTITQAPESLLTQISESQPRALNIMPEGIENGYKWIYYHFTTIKSKKDWLSRKYLVNMSYPWKIAKMEEILPMNKAEREDPRLVQFPIILNYYDPIRGDAFGTSVPDLIEDKQRARSKNFNLNIIKATYEALGGITLYNPFAVRNATDLETPTIGKKYVPVNPEFSGWRMDNIVYDTNMANRTNPDSTASIEALRQEQFYSTNIDATQMGISSGQAQTATANQNTQLNANVKFQLKNRINTWGEKAFWELWYKCYRVAFSTADKKFITINSNRAIKSATLKRKDFIMEKDPRVEIISKTEKLAKDREDKANFMALVPMFLQDPETPKLSKIYMKRKVLKINGHDRDEILEEVPPYYEELMAKQWAELLDNDVDAPKISNLMEDHQTYLMIYQWCEDTDAKWKAIEARKRALLASMEQAMQPQPMWPWQQGMSPEQSNNVSQNQIGNNVSSMMANNAMQSNNAGAKSISQQNAM